MKRDTRVARCNASGAFRRRPPRPGCSSDHPNHSDLGVRCARSRGSAPLRARRSRHLPLFALRQSDGHRSGGEARRPRRSRGCAPDLQRNGGRTGRRAHHLPGRRRTGQHARHLWRDPEDVSAGAVALRHQDVLRSLQRPEEHRALLHAQDANALSGDADQSDAALRGSA